MNMITPEQFRAAWCDEWNTRYAADKSHVDELFAADSTWTEYMLTGHNAFLTRVAKSLGFECETEKRTENVYKIEYSRIDMVFIENMNGGYPPTFNVAIEHENGKHVEDEMWKFIFLRAPLKIIVFYGTDLSKCQCKIIEILDMLDKANTAFPENENTAYLFVVGNYGDSRIDWRWASDKERELKNLC